MTSGPWFAAGSSAGGADVATVVAARPGAVLDQALPAERVRQGQELYDFHCTTCHGATGAGFAEARSAFPVDHHDCFRCHGRANPPIMSPRQIESSQTVFSLGDPPPLRDVERLVRFGTIGGLLDYVRAAMPRWSPGRLSDEESLAVTLYLVRLAYGDAVIDESANAATSEGELRPVRLVPLDGVPQR